MSMQRHKGRTSSRPAVTRRGLLRTIAAGAAATALGRARPGHAADGSDDAPSKHLIVLGAFGGAAIIDSFMAISADEVTPELAETLDVFPAEEHVLIGGSDFRAVDRTSTLFGGQHVTQQSAFANAHRDRMLVATQTVTSVNHTIAQERAITGNGAWNGRTLQEAAAMAFGEGKPLPNVTMGSLGFRADGHDDAVPPRFRAEPVPSPQTWPLSLDGIEGVDNHPDREIVELARTLRNDRLDPESAFWGAFQLSDRLQRWRTQRNEDLPDIEAAELLAKLNFGMPSDALPQFDAADLAALQITFGQLSADPLQSQAALAYLLLKHGISSAVTLSPNWNLVAHPDAGQFMGAPAVLNPPLSFDYSHNDHRVCQAVMWQRMLDTIDALVTLLDDAEHPEAPGESLMDHTLIYLATDFGRTKSHPAGAPTWGSGHHLNNGSLIVSSLTAGNTLLGGVDPSTGLTYGWDPMTGAPQPGTEVAEGTVYAGILQALGVDTRGSGLPSVPAMCA